MPFQKKNNVGKRFTATNQPGQRPRLGGSAGWNLKQFATVKATVEGIPAGNKVLAILNSELERPEVLDAVRRGLKRCLDDKNPSIYLRAVALILSLAPKQQVEATLSTFDPDKRAALARAISKLPPLEPHTDPEPEKAG